MESFADKARALAFALLLHVVCLLVLLAGLWFARTSKPVELPGPVIEAELVGPTAAPKPKSGASRPVPKPKPEPPKPEPQPEPPKPEPPKPEPPKAEPQPEPPKPAEPPKQDLIERERVAAMAQQKAEQAKREQEAAAKRKQIELDEERERKEEAERQRQLDEIRKQREAAEKKSRLEKEKLAQLQDRRAAQKADAPKAEAARPAPQAEHEAERAQTGAGGKDDDLAARYAAAIQAAVTQNWLRPDSAQAGLRCTLRIVQIPGGEVISATVVAPCNADAATRTSIEQAVMRAAPLPYKGYEPAFRRDINFNFTYNGEG